GAVELPRLRIEQPDPTGSQPQQLGDEGERLLQRLLDVRRAVERLGDGVQDAKLACTGAATRRHGGECGRGGADRARSAAARAADGAAGAASAARPAPPARGTAPTPPWGAYRPRPVARAAGGPPPSTPVPPACRPARRRR